PNRGWSRSRSAICPGAPGGRRMAHRGPPSRPPGTSPGCSSRRRKPAASISFTPLRRTDRSRYASKWLSSKRLAVSRFSYLGKPDLRGGLHIGDPPSPVDVDQGVVVVAEEAMGRAPAQANAFLGIRHQPVDPLLLSRHVDVLRACLQAIRRQLDLADLEVRGVRHIEHLTGDIQPGRGEGLEVTG